MQATPAPHAILAPVGQPHRVAISRHSDCRAHFQRLDAAQQHLVIEFATRELYRKIIRPGDAVLDLGANTGFHTEAMTSLLQGNGTVHAFEPNPILWPHLLTIPNCRLWPVAVGDRISVETFYAPTQAGLDQVGSIADPRDYLTTLQVKPLSVPQITLDSLAELQQTPISFIKIDVERREEHCLLGAKNLLQRHKPFIVFENNTDTTEAILAECGYRVSQIARETGVEMINAFAFPASRRAEAARLAITSQELTRLLDAVDALA